MPSLNLDLGYFNHRKTKRLISLLGRGADVLPIRLWVYCGSYSSETGTLADLTRGEIETIAGWWGKSGEMVSAMVKIGFMERVGSQWAMSRWKEHQGHFEAYRERAKKAAAARWGNNEVDASSIPTSSPSSNANDMQCNAGVGNATQGSEVQGNDNTEKPPKVSFSKPTFSEMETYALEIKLPATEINQFFDYHEQKGWKIGKALAPMRDWRAAMRTWNRNRSKFNGSATPQKRFAL